MTEREKDLEAANAVLELKLKEARAEIEQLKALLQPQPSDLDMAIEMLEKGRETESLSTMRMGQTVQFYRDLVDEVATELCRIRTVQNVSHNNEP